jgi:hypothetical protein
MMDLRTEKIHLEKAERDISAAEHRIGEQALRVESLRQGGHDTKQAERLLESMRQMTTQLHQHRELILEQIARLEARNC